VPPPNATIFRFSMLRMGTEYTARRRRLAGEPLATVRPFEVEDQTLRHDAGRIDALVAPVVVHLYVVHVHRLSHIRLLIKVHRVASQVRIIHDAPQVAPEMSVVHGIEAHHRRKEAPVGLRNAVSAKVAPGRNDFLPEIQRFEDLCYGLVVRHLKPER
jgi:hypothetical protein